jgi:hypothetical protein
LNGSGTVWCLDTSAFVNPWNKTYPPDIAPGYWSALTRLLGEHRLVASEEVRREIEQVEDDLLHWVKTHITYWYPLTDAVQGMVTNVMASHPKLVDARKGRSRADPFVIGTAVAAGATIVTTEEYGTPKKPKVPMVCDAYEIPCVGVLDFIRAERIRIGDS